MDASFGDLGLRSFEVRFPFYRFYVSPLASHYRLVKIYIILSFMTERRKNPVSVWPAGDPIFDLNMTRLSHLPLTVMIGCVLGVV